MSVTYDRYRLAIITENLSYLTEADDSRSGKSNSTKNPHGPGLASCPCDVSARPSMSLPSHFVSVRMYDADDHRVVSDLC